MSAQNSDGDTDDSGDDSPGRREVAYRVFAAEFDDSDFDYSESDADRAPNYVVTPTGARVNRLFAVGVLTEVSTAGEDVLRARIADPTGTFVVYAGQYQPDAQTFLERAEPPAYVAVTGKARTFQPDDSDVVYTSIRPESLNEVDEVTRDRWTVGAAEATLERVGTMATAMELDAHGDDLRAALDERGVEPGLAAGIPLALDHYGTTPGYLAAMRTLATSALEVVAGERSEVEPLSLSPDEGGDADLGVLAETASVGEPARTTAGTAKQGESASTSGEETPSQTADETATSTTDDETPSTPASGETESVAATEEEDASATTTERSVESDTADSDKMAAAESATETGGEESEASTDTADAAAESTTDDSSEDTADLEDFDGEFELDEDEREHIKDEFGTEFTSGTEVDEPGEAGIETPDEPIEPETEAGDESTPSTGEGMTAGTTEQPDELSTESEPEPSVDETTSADDTEADEGTDESEDVDLEDAAMDAMSALDDGDGADREAVIERVQDAHGVDAGAVEDAIQEALMSGRCYEPSDGRLKSI